MEIAINNVDLQENMDKKQQEFGLMASNLPLSLNIVVREEKMEKKKVFIVNNEELGVADFGDTLDEAIENFKKSVRLYLETYPEKRGSLLREESPLLISRIFL